MPRRRSTRGFGSVLTQHWLTAVVALLLAISACWYGGNPAEITAAISIIAWWCIVLGSAAGLFPMGRIDRRATTVWVLFLALAVFTALSISWAADGGRAFTKTVQFTSVFGLFTIALLASKPAAARSWAAGITGGLTIIVVIAIASRFFPGIGDDVQLTTNLSGVEGRLSWPLGYWNATGAVAAMAVVGLVWFATHARNRLAQALAVAALPVSGLVIYLTSSRGAVVACLAAVLILVGCGPKRRSLAAGFLLGLVGAMALILVAGSMTDLVHAAGNAKAKSQGLTLLLVAIPVTTAVAVAWRVVAPRLARLGPWKPGPSLIAGAAALVIVGIIAVDPVAKVEQFLSPTPEAPLAHEGGNATTSHLLNASGTGRSEFWNNAIDALRAEPVHGIGAGGFSSFYANNRDSGLVGQHAHSLILQVFAELGVIGGLLLAGIIGLTALTAWQRLSAGKVPRPKVLAEGRPETPDPPATIAVLVAIAIAGSISMAIDWTAEFPVVVAPVVIAVAAIVGPSTRPDIPRTRARAGSTSRDLFATATIVIGGISIWAAATGFKLELDMNASRSAVSNGNYALAAGKAIDAKDTLPSAAAPRVQLALIRELQGDYQDALEILESAIDRDPRSSGNYLLKTRILLKLDRDDEAIVSFRKAKSLDPEGAFFSDVPNEWLQPDQAQALDQ